MFARKTFLLALILSVLSMSMLQGSSIGSSREQGRTPPAAQLHRASRLKTHPRITVSVHNLEIAQAGAYTVSSLASLSHNMSSDDDDDGDDDVTDYIRNWLREHAGGIRPGDDLFGDFLWGLPAMNQMREDLVRARDLRGENPFLRQTGERAGAYLDYLVTELTVFGASEGLLEALMTLHVGAHELAEQCSAQITKIKDAVEVLRARPPDERSDIAAIIDLLDDLIGECPTD